ncbi:MAG: tetratricopeptide repeat protein [Deltaproteobacteria bacterium]|nr:tetratricopeptide repeat protein [Deltaproteobacteria bacterium]
MIRASRAGVLALLVALPLQAAPTLQQRGLKALRQGHAAEAVELLRQAAEERPRDAAIATDLGFALARAGHLDQADDQLRHAITLDPRRFYAYANLAALRSGRPLDPRARDELAALLEQGLEIQRKAPGSSESKKLAQAGLLLALADVERAAGNLTQARARLAQARRFVSSPAQRQLLSNLTGAIDAQAARTELRDGESWPEPAVPDADRRALGDAEKLLESDPSSAAREGERLERKLPGWREPLWLRARALLSLGRLDDAAGELNTLLRLDPSHARAWRLLGETLAEHGGQFEAERADEALRQALALEPAWTELKLLRGRTLLRRGQAREAVAVLDALDKELRARGDVRGGAMQSEVQSLLFAARSEESSGHTQLPRLAEPSAASRDLLTQAQELLARGEDEGAFDHLHRALQDSPTLLEAAALLCVRTGVAPDETVRAIWNDGAALVRLVELVRSTAIEQALHTSPLDPAPEAAPAPDGGTPLDESSLARVVRPWIDRAADLGDSSALLTRARFSASEGKPELALRDLTAAVALGGNARLPEARSLRATLGATGESTLLLQARGLLAQSRTAEAIDLLGRACTGPGASADPERLLTLGRAHELMGDPSGAIDCHRAAIALAPNDPRALERLARAAGSAPLTLLPPLSAELERAASLGVMAAQLPRARLMVAAGRADDAIATLAEFLARTDASEPGHATARALQARLLRERDAQLSAARLRLLALAFLVCASAAALLLIRFRGLTVTRALLREPSLFPHVAKAVAAIRHDALKHRASALSMLDSAPREDVQHALTLPRPASQLVADAYLAVREAARQLGLGLKPLAREPVFGALSTDLQAAEEQLARPPGPRDARIHRAASRMKAHADALGALLQLGPRTRLDATQVSKWLLALEGEARALNQPWTSPALELLRLDLDFPIAQGALESVFANLVRNAQAAAGAHPEPRVRIRIDEERDAAGRRLLVLSVADSSPQLVSIEQISARESGRGLGLVRDGVRAWQGFLRVRPESAPLHKSVEACFP